MLGAWPHCGPGCGPGRRPSIGNLPSGFLPASQETQGEAPRTSLLCSCLEGKAQRCPHTDHESTERERRAGSDGAHFRVKWGRRGRPETSSSEERGWPSGAPGPWATPPSTLGDPTEHPGRPHQAPWGVAPSALTADVLCKYAHAWLQPPGPPRPPWGWGLSFIFSVKTEPAESHQVLS